jgi:hypothetical protein
VADDDITELPQIDVTAPYPSDTEEDLSGEGGGKGSGAPGSGTGGGKIDSPWRLDPLQNIINVSWATAVAVEIYSEDN